MTADYPGRRINPKGRSDGMADPPRNAELRRSGFAVLDYLFLRCSDTLADPLSREIGCPGRSAVRVDRMFKLIRRQKRLPLL